MPLTRDDVVRAAVEVIDADGLAGLTLRGLAKRLGVSAPTLYWHVTDKRHLLDLVAEHVLAELPARRAPTEGEAVLDWLADGIRVRRAALLAHRDSALVVAGNRPTEDALPEIEQTLATLVGAGLAPGEAVQVLTALGSFLLGDVLETQAAQDRPATAPGPAPTGFPTVLAAAEGFGDDEDRFETGLALLLDGLRARLTARTATGVPPV
ncbi:TetR/AcrR family transcriptional regulator C-terminal domain-containing protein [Klenkia taihuensis]|uniref:Transcriptional regulator, TetR family n=1 Tax=Klenkia taihuensis TaxID=1225127 RepID=A0A1I1MLY0_9ACTN|nr:TetR/AcrR family transcriptional regulator C-terminal domain-containing protein [Klenkia taihuensis]GHE14181.1 TetR family transcriptional regulator [Klenkia taihuensis]SFC82560.1 transcriptional regulator, TetR family [Klenkia taihuensis]